MQICLIFCQILMQIARFLKNEMKKLKLDLTTEGDGYKNI